jgi:hypothetical protein
MTPEERVTQFVNRWANEAFGLPITLAVSKLGLMAIEMLEFALAEERENCAQFIESLAQIPGMTAIEIAEEIRARAKKMQPVGVIALPADPDDSEAEPIDFGPCCFCEKTGPTVRNLIMLDKRAKTPGNGCWGCLQCGLPLEGATAILCDQCIDAGCPPLWAIVGEPAAGLRIPTSELTEPFEHDMSKHPGRQLEIDEHFDAESEDW